jgi:hypothetical protein
MIKITITSATVREVPFTDKKGQPAKLYIQQAYAHTFDEDGTQRAYPDRFEMLLPRGQLTGHAAGEYILHPGAIAVSNDGKLTVSPKLVPAPAKKAA